MVFQALLSTVTASSSSSFIVGGMGGSPPESSLVGGMSKDSSKHFVIGSARTWDDLPQGSSRRRTPRLSETQQGCKVAGDTDTGDAPSAAPTFGWWKWHKVEEGPAEAGQHGGGGATLSAMEHSLSFWEKGANEKLNHWQDSDEVQPLFRSSRNYGTFARSDYLYSGSTCALGYTGGRDCGSSVTREDATAEAKKGGSADGHVEPDSRAGSGSCSSRDGGGSWTTQAHNERGGSFVEHALRPGDTLSALALQYRVQVSDIARANGISGMGSHASLLVRKKLRIPVLMSSSTAAAVDEAERRREARGDAADKVEAPPSAKAKTRSCKEEKEQKHVLAMDKTSPGSEADSCYQSGASTGRAGITAEDIAARLASLQVRNAST